MANEGFHEAAEDLSDETKDMHQGNRLPDGRTGSR